jgi:hypothetical protein
MGYAPMASKQDQQKRRKLLRKQRPLGKRASKPGRGMEMPTSRAGLDPIVAEIIEALAGTMADNHNNKRRRLVEFKDGLPLWQIRKDESL